MTNRLIIHLPDSNLAFDSDSPTKLTTLSDFCKEELGAYHATENINELTVDTLNQEDNNKFHSLVFELGLF